MVRLLFKIQLVSLYKNMFRFGGIRGKKTGKIKGALFLLLIAYVVCTMMFSSGFLFWNLVTGLYGTELNWLYFSFMGIFFFGMSLLLSIFSAKSMLYEANDNDLLLSLPIMPKDILASRMLVIATLDLVTSLVFLLPAAAVYVYLAKPAAWFYPVLLVGNLLLSVLSLAVVALVGYIVSLILNRIQTRFKSLVTLIIYVFATGIYLLVFTNLSSHMESLLISGASIAEVIKAYMPPFYYFGTIMVEFNALSFLMLAGWCVIPFLAVYYWLSKRFISIITTSRQAKKQVYRPTKTRAESTFATLLKKEFAKFITTPIYMFNCAFAVPGSIVLGIYLLVNGTGGLNLLIEAVSNAEDFITHGIASILCMLAAMTFTTAPSVSLEGRNLWILKSSPIKVSDIFHAKISLNLILGVSSLLFSIVCIIIKFLPTPMEALIITLLPISMQIFVALMGLLCSLLFPKFNATSDTMVVKQSMCIFAAMLISIGVIAALNVSFFLISPKAADYHYFGLSWIILLNILNAALYKTIMTKGVKIFNNF